MSTVKVRAMNPDELPAGSVALTAKSWVPSVSDPRTLGLEHGAGPLPSTVQANVDPGSEDVNSNTGVSSLVKPASATPAVIVATGGTTSIEIREVAAGRAQIDIAAVVDILGDELLEAGEEDARRVVGDGGEFRGEATVAVDRPLRDDGVIGVDIGRLVAVLRGDGLLSRIERGARADRREFGREWSVSIRGVADGPAGCLVGVHIGLGIHVNRAAGRLSGRERNPRSRRVDRLEVGIERTVPAGGDTRGDPAHALVDVAARVGVTALQRLSGLEHDDGRVVGDAAELDVERAIAVDRPERDLGRGASASVVDVGAAVAVGRLERRGSGEEHVQAVGRGLAEAGIDRGIRILRSGGDEIRSAAEPLVDVAPRVRVCGDQWFVGGEEDVGTVAGASGEGRVEGPVSVDRAGRDPRDNPVEPLVDVPRPVGIAGDEGLGSREEDVQAVGGTPLEGHCDRAVAVDGAG